MKQINFLVMTLFSLALITSQVIANDENTKTQIYVDGKLIKKAEYLLPGQTLKVVVSSSHPKAQVTAGKIGDMDGQKSFEQKSRTITLEQKIDKKDLKRKYTVVSVFYKDSKGVVVDSFVHVFPVKTQKDVDKLANETSEEQLKRVMKELGIKKDKCDSLFKD